MEQQVHSSLTPTASASPCQKWNKWFCPVKVTGGSVKGQNGDFWYSLEWELPPVWVSATSTVPVGTLCKAGFFFPSTFQIAFSHVVEFGVRLPESRYLPAATAVVQILLCTQSEEKTHRGGHRSRTQTIPPAASNKSSLDQRDFYKKIPLNHLPSTVQSQGVHIWCALLCFLSISPQYSDVRLLSPTCCCRCSSSMFDGYLVPAPPLT